MTLIAIARLAVGVLLLPMVLSVVIVTSAATPAVSALSVRLAAITVRVRMFAHLAVVAPTTVAVSVGCASGALLRTARLLVTGLAVAVSPAITAVSVRNVIDAITV